ncbi:MAG: hemin uptake protein HemP [Burkholderiaceae bacterium]|nr:hemin uptake protein HemP [Sulfuritalea sp.]MCF8175806.1 hemin uptake protein HemP [Burkholderiaceae bacterium]
MQSNNQLPETENKQVSPAPASPLPLDSAALLGCRDEIEISHQGATYRLRRTRQGKLILTK